MLNGQYKDILDALGLKQLQKRVDIPQPSLGVDHAEEYTPYDLKMIRYQPHTPTVVIPNPMYIPIEKTGTDHTGNPVHENDFPNTFYLGNPI